MNGTFYIGATGLHAQQRALDVVAGNITNMNTPAYKRSEVRFSELMGPSFASADTSLSQRSNLAAMMGVSVDASPRVFAQGDLKETGGALDLAISGEGFIELLGPNGQSLLWRGGTLTINEEGYLAAANGLPLKALVSVPEGATSISIDRAGEVRANVPGQTEAEAIGRIDLVLVRNMAALSNVEGGLYQAAEDAGVITAAVEDGEGGAIIQGSIESSNVELTDEMVMLMMMQRSYAASAQIVQAGDQLMAIANGLRR
jgi:flagellar basal-body rod protein FlgG